MRNYHDILPNQLANNMALNYKYIALITGMLKPVLLYQLIFALSIHY